MSKLSLLVFIACSISLTGCSLLGVSDSEPHLVTTLEGFGGLIGNGITAAGKNKLDASTHGLGKGECLDYRDICNIGKESQGLRINVKGSAISNGHLTNLVAIVKATGTPENTLDRTIYLHKINQDTWIGETLFSLKTQQPSGLVGEGKANQFITVTVYGDTLSSGSGNLEIELSPYEITHQPPVKMLEKLDITAEHELTDTLFLLPSDFPFSTYPGSKFTSASRSGIVSNPDNKITLEVQFATKDAPEQVVQFYKNDVVSRGYHIKKENPEIIEGIGFYGNNGVNEVTLDVDKDKDDEKKTVISFRITPYYPSDADSAGVADSAPSSQQ